MIEAAKAYAKLFSSRIVYRDKIIAEYSELENTSWKVMGSVEEVFLFMKMMNLLEQLLLRD